MSSTVNVNEPGRPTVDQDEIAAVAALARVRITDDEVAGVTARIADILSMVAALQAVDTTGVEPMANPLDATQPLRPDEVTEGDRRAEFQAIAPAVEDGLYLVPKVID